MGDPFNAYVTGVSEAKWSVGFQQIDHVANSFCLTRVIESYLTTWLARDQEAAKPWILQQIVSLQVHAY